MNKKVIRITGLILIACIFLLGFQWIRYSSLQEKENKKIHELNSKIEKTKKELQEKEKQKQSLEEQKGWKIEVYKTWEKAVNPSV
ncbi:MAG: hypothetical protein IJI60_04845 [Bacilli bacterium]|nr:hypothetical protein [Bacilli bacterium]